MKHKYRHITPEFLIGTYNKDSLPLLKSNGLLGYPLDKLGEVVYNADDELTDILRSLSFYVDATFSSEGYVDERHVGDLVIKYDRRYVPEAKQWFVGDNSEIKTYDKDWDIVETIFHSCGFTIAVTYKYDESKRLISTKYPNGIETKYEYTGEWITGIVTTNYKSEVTRDSKGNILLEATLNYDPEEDLKQARGWEYEIDDGVLTINNFLTKETSIVPMHYVDPKYSDVRHYDICP